MFCSLKKALVITPFFLISLVLTANNEALIFYEKAYNYSQQGDYNKAFIWNKLAADKNYLAAQHNLGLSYKLGLGVTKNYKLAFNWFKKAANQGLADAQTELGLAYYLGNGIVKNTTLAKKYWLLASKQEDEYAQFNLASLYLEQGSKILAIKYLQYALKNNHPQAENILLKLTNNTI